MSNPRSDLTKICSSCGLRKPISAFVLKSGTLGATYGTICATCRKPTKTQLEKEDSTTIRTGTRIDYRTKNKMDLERVKYEENLVEKELENKEKLEREVNQNKKTEDVKKDEKVLKNFLEKSTWLLGKNPVKQTDAPLIQKVDQQVIDTKVATEKNTQEMQQTIQNNQIQDSQNKNETEKKTVDYSVPQTMQIAGQIKHQSSVFTGYQTLLGKVIHDKAKHAQERLQKQKKISTDEKETLSEFVKNTWKPKK